jgi:hypothetical protein
MKKILIAVVACLMFLASSGQSGWVPYASKNRHIGLMSDSLHYIPVKDTNFTPQRLGAMTMRPQDSCVYTGISTTAGTRKWAKLARYSDLTSALTFTQPLLNTAGTISINGLSGYGSSGQLTRSTGTGWEYFTPTYLTANPTWQQVLTAGSTLTGNNTIAGGGFNFTWNNGGSIAFNLAAAQEFLVSATGTVEMYGSDVNVQADGAAGRSYIYFQPGDIELFSRNTGATQISQIFVYDDSIRILGQSGRVNVGAGFRQATDTTQYKPMVYKVATGDWVYLPYWPGGGGGSGTVTSFTFTDGNGFDGTVTNGTTTPTLSLTTTASNKAFVYSNSGAIAGSAMLSQETDQVLVTGTSTAATTPFVVDGHEDLTGNITELKKAGTAVFQFHSSGYINVPEMSAPSTPASGYGSIYGKTDGKLYYKGDGGVEHDLTATGGAGSLTVGTSAITSGTATRVLFEGTGNVLQEDAGLTYVAASDALTLGVAGSGDPTFVITGQTSNNIEVFVKNNDPNGRAAFQMGNDNADLAGFFWVNGSTKTDYAGANSVNFMNVVNAPLGFHTDNTMRMMITGGGNVLIGGSSSPASAVSSLVLFNGTAPSASVANGVVLYSEDVAASAELKVRDEAGNVTTISPHNFTGIPGGPSEKLAWTYHSERDGEYITVDMAKAIRTIEELTARVAELEGKKGKKRKPVKLIHTGKVKTGK